MYVIVLLCWSEYYRIICACTFWIFSFLACKWRTSAMRWTQSPPPLQLHPHPAGSSCHRYCSLQCPGASAERWMRFSFAVDPTRREESFSWNRTIFRTSDEANASSSTTKRSTHSLVNAAERLKTFHVFLSRLAALFRTKWQTRHRGRRSVDGISVRVARLRRDAPRQPQELRNEHGAARWYEIETALIVINRKTPHPVQPSAAVRTSCFVFPQSRQSPTIYHSYWSSFMLYNFASQSQ